MSPIEILATAMAYVIMGDNKAAVEEKGKLLGLLGKHVSKGDLSEDGLKTISNSAFRFAGKVDVRVFIGDIASKLSPAQRLCILVNLYDITLADGDITMGETEIVNQFRRVFGYSSDQMQAVQQVLRVKNETDMFLKATHPMNDPAYHFDIRVGNR